MIFEKHPVLRWSIALACVWLGNTGPLSAQEPTPPGLAKPIPASEQQERDELELLRWRPFRARANYPVYVQTQPSDSSWARGYPHPGAVPTQTVEPQVITPPLAQPDVPVVNAILTKPESSTNNFITMKEYVPRHELAKMKPIPNVTMRMAVAPPLIVQPVLVSNAGVQAAPVPPVVYYPNPITQTKPQYMMSRTQTVEPPRADGSGSYIPAVRVSHVR